MKHKCSKDVRKMTPTCAELLRQWAAYESEHELGWERETLTIEGSVLLRDARSPLANLLFCNWFNEYTRFSERDQLAIANVLLRMGLTDAHGSTTPLVRFLPRSVHYLQSASERTDVLVQKKGHRAGSRHAP